MKKKIEVKQDKESEIPVEIIAQSIVHISDCMKKINASRLNERALIVLLKDLTSLPQRDIKLVLESLAELESMFIKKNP